MMLPVRGRPAFLGDCSDMLSSCWLGGVHTPLPRSRSVVSLQPACFPDAIDDRSSGRRAQRLARIRFVTRPSDRGGGRPHERTSSPCAAAGARAGPEGRPADEGACSSPCTRSRSRGCSATVAVAPRRPAPAAGRRAERGEHGPNPHCTRGPGRAPPRSATAAQPPSRCAQRIVATPESLPTPL